MAEVSRIGIADILRQMRKVEVLSGEVQQMPRALPGAEGTERDASLLLEQVQEARRGQSGGRSTACRRHRPAGKGVDLRNRPDHARIERALRQYFAEAYDIEFGAGDAVAMLQITQLLIRSANAARDKLSFRSRQLPRKRIEGAGIDAFRFDHDANRRTKVAGDGVPLVRRHGEQFAASIAAVCGHKAQAALDRDIDMKRPRATFTRAAEQAGVKYALGHNQHQMTGFADFGVHGCSSSRGSSAAAEPARGWRQP